VAVDVIANVFFRHSARIARAEISAARPAFYPFHQIGWTQGRRGRSQYVHVVLPDVPFLDPDIQTETRLPDQLPRPMDNLPFRT